MMGLFPEIERAYLTIDSDIFVWKYEDGSDLAYFDGLNETILSVALIKPKPDSTYITAIAGTDCGRIFMAGKDGALYELIYQSEPGSTSHDISLGFLVPSFLNFSFSQDGTVEKSNFKSIVYISALTSAESANIHLVAVTQSGALLLVSSQNEDNDLLWAVSSDTFPFQKQLMETQVGDWARMAFFMYGGEAQYNFGATGFQPSTIGSTSFAGAANLSNTIMYSPGGPSGMMPAHMSTPLPYGGSLHQATVGPVPGGLQEVIYSGKHNGIYIYLARILRPFWDTSVTAELQCDTPQGPTVYLTSNYSSEELAQALELVRDLSDFVDFNSKFDTGGPSDV
nr:hypothetical protein BaRGS_008182 [Batillaria attramentaria]